MWSRGSGRGAEVKRPVVILNVVCCLALAIVLFVRVSPKVVQRYGVPMLHEAVWDEDIAAARLLLWCGVDANDVGQHERTALHIAAINGSLKMVVMLIENDADTSLRDDQQKTPLNWAVRGNHKEVAYFILNQGGVPDPDHPRDRATLMLAATHGNSELTRLLIEAGLDVNEPSPRYHHRPLHRAVASQDLETVRVLVHHGAEMDVCDGLGRTPHSIAMHQNNAKILQFLASME